MKIMCRPFYFWNMKGEVSMMDIQDMIKKNDLIGILKVAKVFHGHICPYLALGIRVSTIAMKELGVNRAGFNESVDEEILAIVETNSCFTDGVQVTTGCTLGNNSLIYVDLGKTALTLVKRGSWEGVRIYIDADRLRKYYNPEALELFEKVIKNRNGTHEERKRMKILWEEMGYKMLEIPENELDMEKVKIAPMERAPIFDSVRCSVCGELTMATKIVEQNGKKVCLKCANKEYFAVIGRGIVEVKK
jgi:formylmethanofuran dehydrogenase subunit E